MSKINTDASDTLDTFLSQVEQLDSSWAGNSATAFLNSSSDFISASKSCHNQMADVEMFLYQVIETMENE